MDATTHEQQVEQELAHLESQLERITGLAAWGGEDFPAFTNDTLRLSGGEAFPGMNWSGPEAKGRRIQNGCNVALIIIPKPPGGTVEIELAFRRFHSTSVARKMRTYFNGIELPTYERGKRLTRIRRYLGAKWPSMFPLGKAPFYFRATLPAKAVATATERNILTLMFPDFIEQRSSGKRQSAATIISLVVKSHRPK